jgi:acetylornithine deacetylase/succinyl-diaminopimelate desuccinylase-like protein
MVARSRLAEIIDCHELPLEIVNPHENPPMETDAEHPIVRMLLEAGAGTRLAGAPWFSDAAHLSRGGIPSVCIGPGSIQQAHTVDEWIDLDALKAGAEFLIEFVCLLDQA